MRTSIQNRIKLILTVSLGLVLLMGVATLRYFSQISTDLEQVIRTDIDLERSAQKLKRSFFDLKNADQLFFYSFRTGEDSDQIDETIVGVMENSVQSYLASIEENLAYERIAEENLKRLIQLKNSVAKYEAVINGIDASKRKAVSKKLRKELDKLLDEQDKAINAFLSSRYKSFESHQKEIDLLVSNAHRNILLFISFGVLAMFMLIFLAPQKVVKPIHSYINALRELKDLKFDVRLPIHQKNELADLGEEINSFIDAFLEFDTMKVKKIQFEKRKLQVFADILRLGVIIVSIEGDILFMNSQMASVLKLSSENFQKKDFHFVRLPDELKTLFEETLAKKEKFENRMIILPIEKQDEEGNSGEDNVELLVDAAMVRNYVGEPANAIFTFEDISNKPSESIFKRASFYHKEVIKS